MTLYNASTFLQLIKEDIGLKDIVLPVSDAVLYKRFIQSSLAEFSILAPRIKTAHLSDNDMVQKHYSQTANGYCYEYIIPKSFYLGNTLLGVCRLDVEHPNAAGDYYFPRNIDYNPLDLIDGISSMQLSASIAGSIGHGATRKFTKPNKLSVWNAWNGGYFEVDLMLSHDPALTTIPETAFSQLRELAKYDLEFFLYNELKRKNQLEVVIGMLNLGIDDWSGSGDRFRELIKEWRQDANLDYDSINYW